MLCLTREAVHDRQGVHPISERFPSVSRLVPVGTMSVARYRVMRLCVVAGGGF